MIQFVLPTTKFIPSEFHPTFFDIDFQDLYNKGYRLIITDLDNTLISYEEFLPTEKIRTAFQTLKDIGFEVVLLSNNKQKRLDDFTETLDIKGFANAKKPLSFGIKKAFYSVDQQHKDTTLIVGDQLMTDIWGANRFGVYSILVNPLKRKTEKWYTKLNRNIERGVLQRIKKRYPTTYASLSLEKRL